MRKELKVGIKVNTYKPRSKKRKEAIKKYENRIKIGKKIFNKDIKRKLDSK
jgi:hypothetical protein